MDGLITVDQLRDIFAIDADILDPRLTRALTVAGRHMRSWVGDEAYDDALKVGPTDDDPAGEEPDDPTRKEDLELAEAHLAMHFAILGLNTALRPTGVVREERAEGNTLIRYHSPDEVAKLKDAYLETAQTLANPYLLVDDSVEPFGAVVGGSSGFECEGVTRTCP